MATSEVIAAQIGDQHLAFVQNAAREVAQECRWVTLRGEVTIDIGQEQEFTDYPENAGPGSVEAMAVWDDKAQDYFPIYPKIFPVHASLDQLAVLGNGAFLKGQGRPQYFEQLKQIRTWPATDQPYKLRVRYQRPVEMPTDESMSLVDAMAIIYKACALALLIPDPNAAGGFETKAMKRIKAMRGWHQGNVDIQLNQSADMGEDETLNIDRPRWDDRPSIRPNMYQP